MSVVPLRAAGDDDVLVVLREILAELRALRGAAKLSRRREKRRARRLSAVEVRGFELYPVLAEVVGNMALRQVPC